MKQEQEKVLVKFYEAESQKQVKALKLSEKGLQVIHDEISKMIKGKAAITIEELQSVFEINMYDPQVRLPKPNEEAITELIINRHIAGTEMGGLEINREFIKIPSIENITDAIKNTVKDAPGFMLNGYFEINKGTVSIKQGVIEQIQESFKVYAESDIEIKRYEAAKKAADALNEVASFLQINPAYGTKILLEGEILSIIDIDETGKFIPSDYFISAGRVATAGDHLHLQMAMPAETEPIDNSDFDLYVGALMTENLY